MKAALIVAAGVLIAALPASAQTNTQTTKPAQAGAAAQAQNNDASDAQWMKDAAHIGLAEVELGRLATQKASAADVKQFGERMVADHQKANDELKEIAQKKSVTLPTEPDAKHKAEMDRLTKLSADAFDRAYMQSMVSGHRDAIAKFKTESQSGKDPDVKAFATKTLPTLEAHLKQAEAANKAVPTSGTKAPAQTGTTGAEKDKTEKK